MLLPCKERDSGHESRAPQAHLRAVTLQGELVALKDGQLASFAGADLDFSLVSRAPALGYPDFVAFLDQPGIVAPEAHAYFLAFRVLAGRVGHGAFASLGGEPPWFPNRGNLEFHFRDRRMGLQFLYQHSHHSKTALKKQFTDSGWEKYKNKGVNGFHLRSKVNSSCNGPGGVLDSKANSSSGMKLLGLSVDERSMTRGERSSCRMPLNSVSPAQPKPKRKSFPSRGRKPRQRAFRPKTSSKGLNSVLPSADLTSSRASLTPLKTERSGRDWPRFCRGMVGSPL